MRKTKETKIPSEKEKNEVGTWFVFTFASRLVLGHEPDQRHHRQAPVLHLLDLVLLELGGVAAGEADGVEELAAGVAVAVALEVVGDAEEGAVALGAGVAVVNEAFGLGPARKEERDGEVGGFFFPIKLKRKKMKREVSERPFSPDLHSSFLVLSRASERDRKRRAQKEKAKPSQRRGRGASWSKGRKKKKKKPEGEKKRKYSFPFPLK